ncbi:MAG: CRISPR system precrRNA processing endoribonuclease RAMP protein Cas6 [Bacillota bacterium]
MAKLLTECRTSKVGWWLVPSSFLLAIEPTVGHRFDVDLGSHIHGMLFRLLQLVDVSLAEQIHDRWEKKPFTVSTVLDAQAKPVRELRQGQECFVRITLLHDAIADALDGYFLAGRLRDIHLGEAHAIVRGVYLAGAVPNANGVGPGPVLRRLCRRQTYAEVEAEPSSGVIRLSFLSPTTFRRAGRNFPLPDPEPMFTGLLSRWNNFAPSRLDGEVLNAALADGAVVISYHKIETAVLRLPKAMQIGFVGDVEIRVLDDAIRPTIGTLTRYGFYAGVGYKTSQGMGQVLPQVLA